MKSLAVIGGAAASASLAAPTARFLTAPAASQSADAKWIRAVRIDALAEGRPQRVALVADWRDAWTLERDVQLGAAWLLREGAQVTAWSTVCPHLGCAIDVASGGSGFNCPCHDSSFDRAGRRLEGPSPRDMDSLDTKVEDGFVFVAFRRFRQGVTEKEPMG